LQVSPAKIDLRRAEAIGEATKVRAQQRQGSPAKQRGQGRTAAQPISSVIRPSSAASPSYGQPNPAPTSRRPARSCSHPTPTPPSPQQRREGRPRRHAAQKTAGGA